jgi:hypothetical protein
MFGNVDGGMKKHQMRSANNASMAIENAEPINRLVKQPLESPSPLFTSLFPIENDILESKMPIVTRIRLLMINFLLGVFHTSFAVLVGLGFGDFQTKLDLSIPVYKTMLTFSNDTQEFFKPVYVDGGNLYITWLTLSFFGLSAFFHFAACLVYPKTYLFLVDHKLCPFRWMEYTFSAAIMYLAIAFPTGILNRETLICGFGLISVTMFFGLFTEYLSRPECNDEWSHPLRIRIAPHILGYVPQLVAWAVILLQFLDRPPDAPSPPSFVYALVMTELVLFFSFGLIQLYQLFKPPSSYIYGEIAYMAMSFIAKGSLGAILFTNVLFMSNFSCIINPDDPDC